MGNTDFEKLQVRFFANSKYAIDNKLNSISLELGYPKSDGEFIWIGSGRKYFTNEDRFETFLNSNNEEKYIMRPIDWSNFEKDNEVYVIDLLKTIEPSKLKIRIFLNFENTTEIKELELSDTEKHHHTPFIDIKTEILEIGN